MPGTDIIDAQTVAQHVIARLGEGAPTLTLLYAGWDHGFDIETMSPIESPEPSEHVVLWLTADPTDYPRFGAVYSVLVPEQWAIAAMATQIQDHVLELTHGALLPPCPDHRHPLQVSVVDSVACWVCPHDRDHHVEPVMPPPS